MIELEITYWDGDVYSRRRSWRKSWKYQFSLRWNGRFMCTINLVKGYNTFECLISFLVHQKSFTSACCFWWSVNGKSTKPARVSLVFRFFGTTWAVTATEMMLPEAPFWSSLLSSEFRRRCRVQSRARCWLQLVGCAALLMDASNFRGPDGVGESGVKPRRSLRRREQVKEK